jgi:hypothetical protein
VTDPSDALTIAEFEHVTAGPSATLLRVAVHVAAGTAQPPARPALVAEHPGGLDRFDPLPAPPDPAGVMRAAYSVPAPLIAPEAAFRLELADGSLIELPAPTRGAARPATAAGSGSAAGAGAGAGTAGPDERVRQLTAENERLTSTLAELEVWRGELERRLTETTDQLADARARLTAAELDSLSLRAEAEATREAAGELAEASDAGPPAV